MKFGHTLLAHQVPEWQVHYMDYKKLKQIIKKINQLQSLGAEEEQIKTEQAFFLFKLDENVSKVDSFYCRKFIDYEARMKKITSAIPINVASINEEEEEDILQAVLELRNSVRNLKWFAELNKRGFIKILKKLDKKTGSQTQEVYLNAKINPMLFAHESGTVKLLSEANQLLSLLSNGSTDNALFHWNPLPPPSAATFFKRTEREKSPGIYEDSIAQDSPTELEKLLMAAFTSPVLTPLKTLLSLLNKATLSLSYKCIDYLLDIIPVLADSSDITAKNFIHHHVISLGKKLEDQNGANSKELSTGLVYIFNNLPTHLKYAILQKDNNKRTPLHYAAQYGMASVTETILNFLKSWDLLKDSVPLDDINHWGDSEGLTPVHLAVLGKHVKTLRVLLESSAQLSNQDLLAVTTRLNSTELLDTLVSNAGFDINHCDANADNETALYVACKLNLLESVECLLKHGADTEIAEFSFGWTPIFVAAANGFKEVISVLIGNGAKYFLTDGSGWTPREHAGLRGHVEIIELLTPPNFQPFENMTLAPASNIPSPLLKASASAQLHAKPSKKTPTGYLKENESVVLINIGTTDIRDLTPAVDFSSLSDGVHHSELDTALTLVIKAKSLPGMPEVCLELPLDDNHGIASDPIKFDVTDGDPLDVVVYFDIVPTFEIIKDYQRRVLGRGVAKLRDLYTLVGPKKRSLFNCVRIPILETSSLDILGYIKFEFLCVTSFEKVGKIPEESKLAFKALNTPTVIGHRGNGMNQRAKKSLQLGENTVESFITAASLGASYVEFDVQLTKDGIPVIYHDFTIAETGMDIPMQELTLEQFLHLSEISEKRDKVKIHKDDSYVPSSLRSNSNGQRDLESLLNEFNPSQERMKLTKTWKNKEFKANTRGSFIASSFTTLEELFKKVPLNAGFNIELKYPMLDESQVDDIGQIAFEMNYFCDTILAMVYKLYKGRDIVFSSFHPDICMIMRMKQPTFPVLLLTEAGTSLMADIRASSLQNGIRFAKMWNLFGIVSEATPIVLCPRLVRAVKDSGLACLTYGTANNDPETARQEIKAGVDAVIVDSVLAVHKGLSDEAAQTVLTIQAAQATQPVPAV